MPSCARMIAVRKSLRELTAMRRPWTEALSLSRPSRGMGTPLTCRTAGRIIKGTGGFQRYLPCQQHAMVPASCCFRLPTFPNPGSHPAPALPHLAVWLWQRRHLWLHICQEPPTWTVAALWALRRKMEQGKRREKMNGPRPLQRPGCRRSTPHIQQSPDLSVDRDYSSERYGRDTN